MAAALGRAAAALGPISVLQYSLVPAGEFMKPVLETTPADLVGPIELSVYGPAAAVHAVLPEMRTPGCGSIFFVNGGSAVRPNGAVAGVSVAFAGESAYAQLLHDALAGDDHPASPALRHALDGHQPTAGNERRRRTHSRYPVGAWTTRQHRWQAIDAWWPDGLPPRDPLKARARIARQ